MKGTAMKNPTKHIIYLKYITKQGAYGEETIWLSYDWVITIYPINPFKTETKTKLI